jgi:amino acid transporter
LQVSQVTEVFIRKASGLTRVISPWDALAYAFMNPGIMYCFLYLIWTMQLYPGAYMPIAVIPGVALMFFPALLYIWFSISMPRSGGEYIWGSRILSPAWGFCAGWGLSMVGISWAGSCAYWAISFGFNNALRSIAASTGPAFASHPLWQLADTIDSIPVMLVVGTLTIISFMAIMWRGARASMLLSWFGVITGILGHVVFWIAVLTSGGPAVFIERFNAMSGTTYQALIESAKVGWAAQGMPGPGQYVMAVTVTGGITYAALNTLGSTYTANIMGEIKDVRKSAILAMLGALVLFLVFWVISYYLFYWAFTGEFWSAVAYATMYGSEAWPFTNVPMPFFMLVYLNPNVGYAVFVSLMFAACTYASCMGMAFGPVRNLFAYSFDRVLPTFFSRTDRRGSPWSAVLLGTIIAWIFFLINIFTPTWILYSITAWFFAWAIVSVFGLIFPFTGRGKAIFEKSPEMVKKKIGGLPIMTIWAVLGFIVSGALVIYTLIPFFLGQISSWNLWITAIFFIIPPFVIYYISRGYHKMKGVPMELQFKEIPPD